MVSGLINEEVRFLAYLAINEFLDLGHYLQSMESHIRRSEESQINEIVKNAKKQGIETGPGFWAENLPYWWEQIFDVHLRSSAVVSGFSICEWHLNVAWNWTERCLCSGVERKEQRGTTIQQFKKCFLNVGINQPSVEAWDKLNAHWVLRNALVHNGGKLDDGEMLAASDEGEDDTNRRLSPLFKKSQFLKSHIKDTNGLSLDRDSWQIFVGSEFCSDLLEFLKCFFGELYKGISIRLAGIDA